MNSAKNQIQLNKYADLHYKAPANNSNATPVYGPFERLFISDWGQSAIHCDVVKAFDQMSIKQMTPIQKNAFPYLINNYNAAMIGFSKGKSLSYLASIFSLILNGSDDEGRKKKIGPKAIILTNSLGALYELDKLSKQLNFAKTGNKTKIGNRTEVVIADPSTSVDIVEAALCNGCNILVVTPTSLNNLLKKSKLFSWSNLRHFVFDNIDLLLENYKDEVVTYFQILKKIKDNADLQFISTSLKWTKEVDAFLKDLFGELQYIFGSHLEAAHFMKIEFKTVLVKDDKLEKILQCLINNIKYGRSVLVTSNANELDRISRYMKRDNSDIEVLLASHIKSSIVFMLQKWNDPLSKNQRLLICSDDTLLDYYIDDADCLIHYDVPPEKHKFTIRFSVLQDSTTIFKKKNRSTYIFLSDSSEDMLQLPKVVDVMKVFGNGKLDPVLLKHVKNLNDSLEKVKGSNIPICNELLQFGYCPKKISCHNRHILLKEVDAPADNIPKSGLAIIKVLNVYDASYMSVKLLKLNLTNNLNDVQHWSNVEDNSTLISCELSSFYSNRNFNIIHENPKPGDIVAALLEVVKFKEIRDSEYFRASVIDVINISPTNSQVRVKLIDEGSIELVSKWKIFHLPSNLKSIKSATVDMYVASVKPIDFDKVWCVKAVNTVKKRLQFIENCSDVIIVKVNMALRNTIWVNKVYRKYWDSKSKMFSVEPILPDLLLDFGYADLNNEHLGKLTKLCISAGLYLPPPLLKNSTEERKLSIEEFMSLYKLPQPQWAHLDQSVDAWVSVDCIISPKCFFVRNSKFYDRLSDLSTTINDYIDQKKVEKLKLKHIIEGAICLANYPGTNQYYRVKIHEICSETLVEVMFVDIGEFFQMESNSLFAIHSNLITQLPFQAIECSLNGIKDTLPSGDELDELVGFMFDLTQDLLFSKLINTVLSVQFTGGNHYEVVLYNDDININLELHKKYNQYFDCDLISDSSISRVDNDDDVMDSKELIDQEPYAFDENFFETVNNMDSNNLLATEEFVQEFINGLGKNFMFVKKETSKIDGEEKSLDHVITKATITEITSEEMPITEEDHLCTNETIDETVCIESAEPKRMLTLKMKKSKLFVKRKNQCLTCNNNVQSIVPTCVWYQDRNNIYLKFGILEMDNFSLNCAADSIMFKASLRDVTYTFRAVLCGYINDENVSHHRSYEGFHCKAEKLLKTDYKWPRLLKCVKWHKYITYNVEHIDIKNTSLWLRELDQFKSKAIGTRLQYTEIDSDSSDSSNCNSENDDTVDC